MGADADSHIENQRRRADVEAVVRTKTHVTAEQITADSGIVIAEHPLAVEAGLAMLRAGGNAVDAAAAAGFAMGVVQPPGSGLGGGGIMLIARPGARPAVIEFTPQSPTSSVSMTGHVADSAGGMSWTTPTSSGTAPRPCRAKSGGWRWPWSATDPCPGQRHGTGHQRGQTRICGR
jgi:gamma-glutamyltranspeptidase